MANVPLTFRIASASTTAGLTPNAAKLVVRAGIRAGVSTTTSSEWSISLFHCMERDRASRLAGRPTARWEAHRRSAALLLLSQRLDGVVVEVFQAVPGEVDEVGGHVFTRWLSGVEPPLTGERDHADERSRDDGRDLPVVTTGFELPGQQALDVRSDVADHARQRAGRASERRIAHEHPETVFLFLDVGKECLGCLFQGCARTRRVERFRDAVEQAPHFVVDDHRVEAFFSSEVLVHDGLAHLGAFRDLLDRRSLVSLLGEDGAPDPDELLPAFPSGHAHTRRLVVRTAALVRERNDHVFAIDHLMRFASICVRVGTLTAVIARSPRSSRITYQPGSICQARKPRRADQGNAW